MTTTQQISDSIVARLETSLNQNIPLLPKSFIRVLAKTLAGVHILLYKYAGWMTLQLFISTARDQDTTVNGVVVNPLEEWGNLFGVSARTDATQAELLIDITVNDLGGTLPTGTQLTSDKNGVTYLVIQSVQLDASTVQTTVRAFNDQVGGSGFGAIGNLVAGDELNFANPLGNVARVAVVNSQAITGAEQESTAVYRQRIIDKARRQPQGGAYADYIEWAEGVAGILNAYAYTGQPGQVNVYSEATVVSSGNADGIPTTAQLQAVLDACEFDVNGLASRRPLGAFVNSLPITRIGFNVTVTGISGVSDIAQVRSDISTALTSYFLGLEPFIIGSGDVTPNDKITRTRISSIVEDIVTAGGGIFSGVSVVDAVTSQVINGYSLLEGQKAKLGTLSWT